MIDYLESANKICELCEKFRDDTINTFFGRSMFGGFNNVPSNAWFCYTPRYQNQFNTIKGAIEVSMLLSIDLIDRNKEFFRHKINQLFDIQNLLQRTSFEDIINSIIEPMREVENEIKDRNSRLKDIEKIRLNEAMHCFFEDCHYSSVIMCVSAMEFRLLELMKSANPNEERRLGQLTLGKLINEYLNDKEKYKNIVPKKYESLLNLCNTYRIFSVHPKTEKINSKISISISNLTFEFLLDKNMIR